MADLRYCSATNAGLTCDLRYDHDGLHHDRLRNVSWPRLVPPTRAGLHGPTHGSDTPHDGG